MKRLFLFMSLAMALFFVSCKDKSVAEEVKVISVEEVREAMGNGEFQLIDVRTIEEFGEGHLKNAKNICVTDDDFKEKVAKLNRDEPVYLYCRSGKRSARAGRSEEHTSELQSRPHLVCRLLLEKKKKKITNP